MAIQIVNVGQIENDGTGDDLREAFIKVNENFSELSTLTADIVNIVSITGNNGTLEVTGYSDLSIIGEYAISTNVSPGTITIVSDFNQLSDDLTPTLSNNLDVNNFSINNVSTINGITLTDLSKLATDTFDFGLMNNIATNIIDWFIANNTVDLGSFSSPNTTSIDSGLF